MLSKSICRSTHLAAILALQLSGFAISTCAAFTVHDKNDKAVGAFYPPDMVEMTPGIKHYAVRLATVPDQVPGRLDYESARIFFRSADCSGTAYAEIPDGNLALPRALTRLELGRVLLYPVVGPRVEGVESERNDNGECIPQSQPYGVFPLGEAIDVTHRYRAPFRVK